MKPYCSTWDAASYYRRYKNKRFDPYAFREHLLAGLKREIETMKRFTYPENEDFLEWYQELERFDYCFWTWATDY